MSKAAGSWCGFCTSASGGRAEASSYRRANKIRPSWAVLYGQTHLASISSNAVQFYRVFGCRTGEKVGTSKLHDVSQEMIPCVLTLRRKSNDHFCQGIFHGWDIPGHILSRYPLNKWMPDGEFAHLLWQCFQSLMWIQLTAHGWWLTSSPA